MAKSHDTTVQDCWKQQGEDLEAEIQGIFQRKPKVNPGEQRNANEDSARHQRHVNERSKIPF